MRFMPRSTAAWTDRMPSASSIDRKAEPKDEPPYASAETRSPVLPSGRYSIAADRSITALLKRAAKLLHKRLPVLWAGAVARLADLSESGPPILIDDPLAGYAVTERDRSTRHRARNESDLVDRDTDVPTCWRKFVAHIVV